ncbi:MAG: electron transfer flavoprotein alpha subunit [Desulfovibrionales bacterium]|jgi:electron transfer flavoprotein alpha subunit|nr:electron transfer flavoprotein alpha subunit [Desulfovibrionales bacterium]
MTKILFVAPAQSDGGLDRPALEALAAAKTLAESASAEFKVGVFGADVQTAAGIAAGAGAEVFTIQNPELAAPRYATDAAAMEALCKAAGADVVVAAADSRMSRIAAGVAQRLGGKADTQLTGLSFENGKVVAARWFYRQRMVGKIARQAAPWIVTVAPGCFEPYTGQASDAAGAAVDLTIGENLLRTKTLRVDAPSSEEQTIRPDAELLFVAGAGWTKKQADGASHVPEAGEIILEFLDKAKASLGSSKSLVDMGGEGQDVLPFLTHMHQVGQTGATPRHPKGLATCCHGEEPHVVGWRFINERRAVNLDAGCGWAQGKADVLYVADAFAVMRKVSELLAK